ncbi:hypothetical protein GCM10010341_86320 [Streptomyces noursei]|nr:hypothetical protein GCM10010341_86320 [Streptomyces noursei]
MRASRGPRRTKGGDGAGEHVRGQKQAAGSRGWAAARSAMSPALRQASYTSSARAVSTKSPASAERQAGVQQRSPPPCCRLQRGAGGRRQAELRRGSAGAGRSERGKKLGGAGRAVGIRDRLTATG